MKDIEVEVEGLQVKAKGKSLPFFRKSCAIPSCTTRVRRDKKLSYHSIPSLRMFPDLRKQWLDIIRTVRNNKNWEPGKDAKICGLHFPSLSYHNQGSVASGGLRLKAYLDRNAVPTLRLTSSEEDEGRDRDRKRKPDKDSEPEVIEGLGSLVDTASTENDQLSNSLDTTTSAAADIKRRAIICPSCSNVIPVHMGQDRSSQTTPPAIESPLRNTSKEDSSDETLGKGTVCSNQPLVSTVSCIELTPEARVRLLSEHNYTASPIAAAIELASVKKELIELKVKFYNLQKKLERRDNAQKAKDELFQQRILNWKKQKGIVFKGSGNTRTRTPTTTTRVKKPRSLKKAKKKCEQPEKPKPDIVKDHTYILPEAAPTAADILQVDMKPEPYGYYDESEECESMEGPDASANKICDKHFDINASVISKEIKVQEHCENPG